jgi:TonB family protein
VIHLGEGTDQTAPVWLTSPAPPYPPEALAAKVSGMVLARCNAYPDGGLRDCKILKSHSFFDAAVLAHLARANIKPFTSGGKPVNGIVALNIPIRFTLPP